MLCPLQDDVTPKTEYLPELPFSLDVEENFTEEQKKLLNAMLHRHVGAFSLGDDDLGYINNVKHGILNLQQELSSATTFGKLDAARHNLEKVTVRGHFRQFLSGRRQEKI